jgi:PIN domain nuclease of toxin-antitoxin system
MRTLVGIAAAGLAAFGLGFWLSSATDSPTEISSVAAPTTVSQISIWEIHNQAHLEFLPVQQIEDQSLIFTASKPTSSERR